MTAWDAMATKRSGVPMFAPGHVWLAGAGPGDPGLLTLDALAGLTQADVVVHDALVDERVLALAGPQARLEFAGKRGGKPSAPKPISASVWSSWPAPAIGYCGSRAVIHLCLDAAARKP
jgi:uroporphyrin-III C-methyltransferase